MRFYQYLPDNTVLCLLSPTASGKTDLACQLYQTGRFELISVDSALIYQDMNITSKWKKSSSGGRNHVVLYGII